VIVKHEGEDKNIPLLPNESPFLNKENEEEESKGIIETAIKDDSKQSTIYH
jgi:hypothetical protein